MTADKVIQTTVLPLSILPQDNVHKAAQDARDTTAAKAQTAVDNATALVNPTPPLSGTAVYTFNLYSNASDPQDPYVSPSAELRCCVFALFFWS